MYKLSEDVSKSAIYYEFTKKIGFSNLPRYRSKEAIYPSNSYAPSKYVSYIYHGIKDTETFDA
jgi:hypothetical protein